MRTKQLQLDKTTNKNFKEPEGEKDEGEGIDLNDEGEGEIDEKGKKLKITQIKYFNYFCH